MSDEMNTPPTTPDESTQVAEERADVENVAVVEPVAAEESVAAAAVTEAAAAEPVAEAEEPVAEPMAEATEPVTETEPAAESVAAAELAAEAEAEEPAVTEAAAEPVIEAAPAAEAEPPAPTPAPVVPTVIPGKPRIHPSPSPVVAVPAPVEAAVPVTDPRQWGRIDEAGVVYVRTADGERVVGEWQAGDAEAGLAHFGRRFDDFATEIALLEARLASGAGDAKATRTAALQLRESLPTLAAVGDLDGAAARLTTVIADADSAIAQAAAERAQARADAIAAKEALCAEAERLISSTQWKTAGDRLKSIVDEWRVIRGIDRKTDDALWKRFSKARDAFNRSRGSHFAELDKQRLAAKEVKEKLIKQAESLSSSREWRDTTAAYRDLMTEWKAAGRAPREIEDELWARFRAAQEAFFARRNEVFAERDAEFGSNAEAKRKLLVEAEQIDPATGLEEAKRKLRSVQERWEAAGKVPRELMRELDGRLRAVEDAVRAASEAEWRRTDPEAIARVEQFRSRVEQFREQAAKARAAGDERRAAEAEKQAATWQQWLEAAENAVES